MVIPSISQSPATTDCALKIIDFGLARTVTEGHFTEYVVTRWYRAPEVVIGSHYDTKYVIWSQSCASAQTHGHITRDAMILFK